MPSVIEIGNYKTNEDSIALRPSPSNIDTRYMEKGKIYPFSFQLLFHNKNNYLGFDTSQRLLSDLENLKSSSIISADNSFSLITIQCTTTPNYVEDTIHGVLWTALFEAELYIQGGK